MKTDKNMTIHRWIDDQIVIDFKLPEAMLDIMKKIEELDQKGDYAVINYANTLDIYAKKLYSDGVITKKQWDTLIEKYRRCF